MGGTRGSGTSQRNDGRQVSTAAELARLRRISDPERRIGQVSARLSEVRAQEVALAELRDATVRELRERGWSHGQIAAVTGLTRGRVAQISGVRD